MMQVYLLYSQQSKVGRMSMQQAIQFISKDAQLNCHPKDAIYCFGMSLHLCTDVVKYTMTKVMHIQFEEFLEMIGRVAEIHFSETQ